MLLPVIAVVMLLRVAADYRMFDLVYVVTQGGPGDATQNLSMLAYQRGLVIFRSARRARSAWRWPCSHCRPPAVLAGDTGMKVLASRSVRVFVLLVAVGTALAPVLWIVSTSFKTQVDASSYPPRLVPEHPTLSNYTQVLTSTAFQSALLTSVLITVLATVLTLLVAYPCAYSLVRMRPHGRRLLVLLIAFAQTIPGIVFVIPLYSEAVQLGVYDTRRLMIVVYAAFLTPFATLTLSAFLRSVPIDVEEAGLIDGCGRLGLLFRIVIPMTRRRSPRPRRSPACTRGTSSSFRSSSEARTPCR